MKSLPEYAVSFGSHTITFTLKFSSRKTLGITVSPDQSVTVTSPEGKRLDHIKKIVKKRAPWILKQQREFGKSLPRVSPRQYVSGETWRYLGRQYRLKIYETGIRQVKLKHGLLIVEVTDPSDREKIIELLAQWYRNRALEYFTGKAAGCYELLRKYQVPLPDIQLRVMHNRWGSCTQSGGLILLHPDLIKQPSHCVEYVIMHEMCHLKHPNHGPGFYRLLSRVMPDWQKRKQRLDDTAHEVL
jgi:predicted metal-dependent hydrolase